MMESRSDELKRTWYINIPKSSTKRLKLTEIRVTISSPWYGAHSFSLGDGLSDLCVSEPLLAFDLPASIEPSMRQSIMLDVETFTVKAIFKNSTGSRVQEQYIEPISGGGQK